jgi:hypothetical protein
MSRTQEWLEGYKIGKMGGLICDRPADLSGEKADDWISGFLVGARDRHSDEVTEMVQ